MNANIVKTPIFHKIKYDLKGHSRSQTMTFLFQIHFFKEVQGVERSVEAILSSYHSASDFRDELVHGFILVYSARRKASLSTLRFVHR